MHIGKHKQYFVDDPTGKTNTKQKEYVEKIKKANKVVQAPVHEEDQRHAQEEAKKEKQKQGRKVVHFNLWNLYNPCMFQVHLIPTLFISNLVL